MQILIVVGIIGIIILAIELSVIAYFAVLFFLQAIKVAKKTEEIEDKIQNKIQNTADYIDKTIGLTTNKIISEISKILFKKEKKEKKKK